MSSKKNSNKSMSVQPLQRGRLLCESMWKEHDKPCEITLRRTTKTTRTYGLWQLKRDDITEIVDEVIMTRKPRNKRMTSEDFCLALFVALFAGLGFTVTAWIIYY